MSDRIAVIPGDGIGIEVMAAAMRVLEPVNERHALGLSFDWFDFASAEYWQRHGTMLPSDWFEVLKGYDAILFGAVGWPEIVPDHVSLWGSLIQFRRSFDLYISLRPCKLMPGIPSPLRGREPGDIDFVVVRENTEGEYSSVGGRMFEGTDREIVMQQTVMTRTGVDRVLRYAYELARRRPRHLITSATKSNGITISMPFWDERFAAVGDQFPDIERNQFHIDILAAHFVQHPDWFDVVVASNLFGDILSDLGPACTGTIGIAPSGNINPERRFPSLFEPVHGSAPDIAGLGIANPIGQIWSAAMMLEHLGHAEAAAEIVAAFERVLSDRDADVLTPDIGGRGTTATMTDAVVAALGSAE